MIIKKTIIDKANRLYQLPPEILSFLRTQKQPSLLRRKDQLDLATFNWPIEFDVDAISSSESFKPAAQSKIDELKEELAGWFNVVHKAKLNPKREIFVGGSISDIMLALMLAFVDNGDLVFVPEIGIPLYRRVTSACGGQPVAYGISMKNNWSPDFQRVNSRLGRVARLLILNSPHNPTGAEMTEKDFENLAWIAGRENISLVCDAAYQSISGRKHASLMSITGGRKIGIEVYSIPYLFGLPPVPFGFAVGNADMISGLQATLTLVKPFIPAFLIDMAITAIRQYPNDNLAETRKLLARNSAEVDRIIDLLSLERCSFDSTPFVWAKIKRRSRSTAAARTLYRRSRIIVAPGTGFGDSGEGFLRFSLTAKTETYAAALARLKKKIKLVSLESD